MRRFRWAGVAAGAALALGTSGCVHASVTRTPAPGAAKVEIEQMMARSAATWNRGDLDGFLDDYEPEATYIGRGRVLRGRAEIRTAYAARFAPGGQRDSLSFERVEVDPVGPDVVNTIGWYRLSRGDSTVAVGPTSLVMRRSGGRWRIVHDHSS